ncbi:MAG: DUF2513 domain-containing protein [Hyphomonas sp.]|jgi:hypothetical protein|nr:DUF2513 domain-containing protein [Hyphomonas sp.]
MKRDMDLVRAILLNLEQKQVGDESEMLDADDFPSFSADTVYGHFSLLLDAGFVDGKAGGSGLMLCRQITWQGHEFLDATRDAKVWEKTKDAANAVGGWTAGLLKDLATAILKSAIKDTLKLDM